MIIVVIILSLVALVGFYIWTRSNQQQQPVAPASPDPTQTEPIEEEEDGTQEPVTGDKIYPDANPPHECTNVTDGEKEQGGDRREPQIVCGFDFLNTEATCYFRVTGTVNDTLSVKLRGPKHSSPTPESDMCNNIHYIALGNNNSEPFGKQAGHTAEYCEFGGSSVKAPDGTWVGVKAIEWNEGSGVHFQTWIENPEGSGWKLVADAVDNGGAGSCSGPAREAYTTSPCQDGSQPVSIGWRVDGLSGGGDVEFRDLSVREIAVPSTPLSTAPSGNLARVMMAKVGYSVNSARLSRARREFAYLNSYRSIRLGNFV